MTTIHHDIHHKTPSHCTTFFQNTPQKHQQNSKKPRLAPGQFFLQIYLPQPALNICLIPRSACRVRSSFSINENRTCPSPCSPKPTPGLTATFASSSSLFENSTDPSARYCSGIFAHANIVAFGRSTGQPSLFS